MKKNLIISILALIVAGLVIYLALSSFYYKKGDVSSIPNTNTVASTTPQPTPSTKVSYRNNDYGFVIDLPTSWENYTIILDPWEGYSLVGGEQKAGEEGYTLLIRHPDWEYKSPRQDIPIMIFTLKQWNDMQADKFHIGAAPVNPRELGRNSKYVFAVPARYNFSYLTGYEEVEEILQSKAFRAF
ncbi:MAG: hypothetical protein ABL917_03265 [Parcubacteria group bacterium]